MGGSSALVDRKEGYASPPPLSLSRNSGQSPLLRPTPPVTARLAMAASSIGCRGPGAARFQLPGDGLAGGQDRLSLFATRRCWTPSAEAHSRGPAPVVP